MPRWRLLCLPVPACTPRPLSVCTTLTHDSRAIAAPSGALCVLSPEPLRVVCSRVNRRIRHGRRLWFHVRWGRAPCWGGPATCPQHSCSPTRTYPYTPFRIYCYNGRTKYVPKNTSSAVGSSQTLPFHRAVTNGHVVHPDSAVSFATGRTVTLNAKRMRNCAVPIRLSPAVVVPDQRQRWSLAER